MSDAIKTTVYLDADDYRRHEVLARAELVRTAFAEYVRRRATAAAPASIGAGSSGRGDVSVRSEELLGDGFGR